ncbi:MAG TPA: ABC transporter permease subunit [Acidimicrobiia bacterium]|nr:ABC transporter permease subunit [Acidimicrobiia bacterium]
MPADAPTLDQKPNADGGMTPASEGSGHGAREHRVPRWLRPWIPMGVLVVVWWVVTDLVLQKPRIYPTPQLVAGELGRILSGESPLGSTYAHAGATLARLLVAFLAAFVIGTVLGIVAGRVKSLFDFSNSLVWIGLAVPSVVWVFVFLVVFGIGDVVPVVALVVMLTTPVFLGSAEGAKAIDRELLEMAASYRADWRSRLRDLYLPAILPFMLANGRVAFALGIKVVIIAEVVGLPNGIGLLVKYWKDQLYMAPVVAWGVLLIVMGFVVDRWLFGYFEKRSLRRTGARVSVVSAE